MYLFLFFLISDSLKLGLRIPNYNNHKIYRYNDASCCYNKSNHPSKISPVEDDEIQIIDTGPALNTNYPSIGRYIVFPANTSEIYENKYIS